MKAPGVGTSLPTLNLSASASSWRALELGLAFVTAFVIGTRYVIHSQVVVGYAVAFALFPLWVPSLRKLLGARLLFGLTFLALISGVLLQWWRSADHAIDSDLALVSAIELLGVFSAAAALYWAMTKIGPGWALLALGAGMLLFVRSDSNALYTAEPWRYLYALPVAVVAFGVAIIVGKRWFEVVVLLALTLGSVVAGSRSVFGIFLLTIVLLIFGRLRGKGNRLNRRSSALLTGGLLLILALAVVNFGQALLLEGYLGEAAQARTELQVDTSGSLLLGGRPELGASIALIASRVWGMGLGVMPNWADMQAARAGMAASGYDPLNGYVDNYMFGEGFRLHSMFGDLWAVFGIPGLLIVVLILWLAVKVINLGSMGVGDVAVYYVTLQTVWNAFFAPWYSGLLMLIVFLALAWYRFDTTRARTELTPTSTTT